MDKEAIREQHEPGLKGLLKLYPRDLLKQAVKWPLIVTSILFTFFIIFRIDSDKIVISIIDSITSVMPSLLGFLLGGYTILLSFSNSSLLKALTKKTSNRNISVFQMLSCIFALTILMQSATLTLALIARFSILNAINIIKIHWLIYPIMIINYLFGFVLMFLLLYTVFAFKDIITNIFSLTQLFHQKMYIERVREEEERAALLAALEAKQQETKFSEPN